MSEEQQQGPSGLVGPDGQPLKAPKAGFVDQKINEEETLRLPMVAAMVIDGKILEALANHTANLVVSRLGRKSKKRS